MSQFRQTLTALKAIGPADRIDGLPIFVVEAQSWYFFDEASSETEALPLIAAPNTGAGRWKDFTVSPLAEQIFRSRMVSIPATLTDAASIVIDASQRNTYRCQLTTAIGATRSLAAPTNPLDNQVITIQFLQPAAGGAQVTWPSSFRFATGSPTLLDTGVNRIGQLQGTWIAPLNAWAVTLINY